jgi:WD40-like Beta Propeller Repeat
MSASRSRSFTRLAAFASLIPLALAAPGCAPTADGDATSDTDAVISPRAMMRTRDPGNLAADNLVSTSAPAGAHLTYFGGRVVSNVQVVQVLYGSGSYLPQVTSTATPGMATFYQQITNGPYFDWLADYTVSAAPHGSQVIGRGSFVRQVQITPAASNNGTVISDANVQAELAAQINAGVLPAPTMDAAGNTNTYYAIFFPHGKTITQGSMASCQQFCAYHGTIASVGGREVYYGVHPDMQAGSGCDIGCGGGTLFANQQAVASHELVETVTDPEIGLATTFAAPLAWYDQTDNSEIGDLCNGQQATVAGADGQTYTVQNEFSNSVGDCIATKCDPNKAFGTPTRVANVSSSVRDQGAVLVDDLTLYLGSDRAGSPDLYMTTRSSPTGSFATPVPLTNVNGATTGEIGPYLTGDGLTMYYAFTPAGATFADLYVTTRTSKSVAFSAGTPVANVNSTSDEEDPYVTPDGSALYFDSGRGGTQLDMYVATRQSNGSFGTPQPLTNLNTSVPDGHPRLTQGGLRIYWSSTRSDGGALGGTDIWTATRSSTSASFGTPTRVPELSSTSNESPSWVSPDGCTMYFQSDRPGGLGAQDIYVAVKPK